MKSFIPIILLLVFTFACQITFGKEVKASKIGPQEITAISSMQFYTNFALIRTMLEGKWDDEVFQQFSYYDGTNLQMMKDYEAEMTNDKIWGKFLRQKNAVHHKIYEDLKPLISKKRENKELSKDELLTLESLNKLIYEKLIA